MSSRKWVYQKLFLYIMQVIIYDGINQNNSVYCFICHDAFLDVCGRQYGEGGFDRYLSILLMRCLDLPEPWMAIDYSKFMKPGKIFVVILRASRCENYVFMIQSSFS